jgi:hypothetical protein
MYLFRKKTAAAAISKPPTSFGRHTMTLLIDPFWFHGTAFWEFWKQTQSLEMMKE